MPLVLLKSTDTKGVGGESGVVDASDLTIEDEKVKLWMLFIGASMFHGRARHHMIW